GAPADRQRDRAKPQERWIGDLAGVQESTRLQQAQLLLRSARREKPAVEVVRMPRHRGIAGAVCRMPPDKIEPFPGQWRACAAPRQFESRSRPFMVAAAEQREIEQ